MWGALVLLAGLAACAVALPVPAASAALQPSATANLVDEGGDAKGFRTVRVDVNGTCGPAAAPGTTARVSAEIFSRWLGDRRAPYRPTADRVEILGDQDSADGTSGSFRFRLSGGLRATAVGTIECTEPPAEEFGDPATAKADSPFSNTLQVPVRLKSWEERGMSYSYRRSGCRPPRRGMGVGVSYDIAWHLDLDTRAALGASGLGRNVLSKIRLHIAGGGRRTIHFSPSRNGYSLFRLLLNGFHYTPRKAKPVRLWATVNGLDSNVITVPVKRRPRGC